MYTTGSLGKDGRSYHRRLLSEYRADITLANYIEYFKLKSTVKSMKKAYEAKSRSLIAADFDLENERYLSDKHAYDKLEEKYFTEFEDSFQTVKEYLKSADKAVVEQLADMRRMTEEELRNRGELSFHRVYIQLHTLIAFRDLNCAGFGKVLQKLHDRCALNSLDLQAKLRQADQVLAHSSVAVPPFDINKAIDYITCLHSIVFKKTFEVSMNELKLSVATDMNAIERIVPMPAAYFYQRQIPCKANIHENFKVRLLPGTSNPTLAKHIGYVMVTDQTKAKMGTFANGEVSIKVEEPVRGDDCFLIQSIAAGASASMSTSLMELLLQVQTVQQAAAARVTAVVPYMAYTHRTIESSAVAELFEVMRCDRIITVDMYKEQVEGFFGNLPVENISAKWEFVQYLTQSLRAIGHDFTNIVVVSPDSETVGRARAFADSFMRYAGLLGDDSKFVGVVPAIKRVGSETIDLISSVKGKTCIIVDNVIEEGINIAFVAEKLHAEGAKSIRALATHALFSGDCVNRLKKAPVDEVIVTDSINQDRTLRDPSFARKLRVIPVAPLLSGAIQRVHSENSVSTLLEK